MLPTAATRTCLNQSVDPPSARWLARAGVWLVSTLVAGQTVFGAYVVMFYGAAAWRGDFAHWGKVLPRGWQAAQPLGNAALALHLLFSVVVLGAGAVQLVATVRQRWPALHRWMGRLYILSACVLSLGGLGLVWVRGGAAGDASQHVAISLNALQILTCSVMAWRSARAREIARHRQWALRLFASVGGVFFFRLGLMAWLAVNRAPVGFDPRTFSGPFLTALAVCVYVLVPLTVVELYLRSRLTTSNALRWTTTGVLGALTLVAGLGVVAAFVGMWWPRMR